MEYVTVRATDFHQIAEIYKTRMKQDFARNELKPLAAIQHPWERQAYDVYFLTCGEATLGYAGFVRKGNDLLFDYLAVSEGHRDQGLGSIFLKQLAECLTGADCVVGEVEDPDAAENEADRNLRERRLKFYLRNGYRKTEVKSKVFGVDYRILEVPVGVDHSTEEIRKIYSDLYRSILPSAFYRTQFKVDGGERNEMNPLDKHVFYKPCKKLLISELGILEACQVWEEASEELERITEASPELKKHNGAMVLPAVALYRTLSRHGKDAEKLLNAFGDEMGERFAKVVHGITSIPRMDKLIWKNVDKIMHVMSGPKLGYERRIVSDPPQMFGVDILSCPYHELAKVLGEEKAVLCICHMDKKYMQGFHHIRYERSTAVSEGAECCDYRLRFDKAKK